MSLTLVIPILGIFILLISQFGGKITAKSAFVWWLVFGFVLICTIFPEWLVPVTLFFGIQLVSNLVLASLILFLFFYVIQESSMLTKVYRKQRDLISSLAADQYIAKSGPENKKQALVFFPCFNEEKHIPTLISNIHDLETVYPGRFEFCIINDGSSDLTESLLNESAKGFSAHHSTNSGVSGVLSTAFRIARIKKYEYVIQVDSDGQHPLPLIPELLDAATSLKSDLLIGSRFVNGRSKHHRESTSALRSFGSLLISILLKMFSIKKYVADPTSGFRVYSRKSLMVLSGNLPDEYPEPESIALLLSAGLDVQELPVEMKPRITGKSSLGGINGYLFMMKVSSALIGLRLRTLIGL
jgi:hypothetical protein